MNFYTEKRGGLCNRHAHLGKGGKFDDLRALEFQLVADAVDFHVGGGVEAVIVGSPFGDAVAFRQDALKGDAPVLLLAVAVSINVGFPFGFGAEFVGFVFHVHLFVGVVGMEANLGSTSGTGLVEGASINGHAIHKGEIHHLLINVAVDVVVGVGEIFVGGDNFVHGHGR